VALYQEQVMRIANVLAGFSMAEGDGLRKAMGKKLPEQMAKYQDRFITGCVERQIDKRLAAEIFAMIERFAGYGFPKAHSAAYAVIAAQTAYLKANFPVEFMAALLSTELGNTERIVALLAECRRAGIGVLPPSINRSDVEFSVEPLDEGGRAVRFGLAAIKGVGSGAVRTILSSRSEQPGVRFASLSALCDAIDWTAVNRRTLESFARAGALDDLGSRGGILEALEPTIAAAQKRQRASARGQMDLFGAAAPETAAPVEISSAELPSRQVLEWEKELLGTYMSDHPLSSVLRDARRSPDSRNISEIAHLEERAMGSPVRILAMVANVRRIVTKANRTMAVAIFEDLSGRVDVVLFPETYERHSDSLADGEILDVRGRLDRRGEALQIVCESVSAELPAAAVPVEEPDPVIVRFSLGSDEWTEIRAMQQADEIIQRHEGTNPVVLEIPVRPGQVCQLRSRSRRVEWSAALAQELLAVAGVAEVSLLTEQPSRLAS
jgi:DNA polymerase-3 subunit alpha